MTKKTAAAQAEPQEAGAERTTYVVQWDLRLDGRPLQAGDEITATDEELQAMGLAGSAVLRRKG